MLSRWTYLGLGFVGVVLLLHGFISSIFYDNIYWYSPMMIGGTLVFVFLNKGNKGSLGSWKFRKLASVYLVYLIAGIIIELIGYWIMHLWYIRLGWLGYFLNVILSGYPGPLFFIQESFIYFKRLFTANLSFLFTWILATFISEIHNLFEYTWVYTIPYITLEFLQINVM